MAGSGFEPLTADSQSAPFRFKLAVLAGFTTVLTLIVARLYPRLTS
jgi:hypothetical protein